MTDKTQAELELIVGDNFDEYVEFAKNQMQGDVENLKSKDLENKVALAQIFELVVAN